MKKLYFIMLLMLGAARSFAQVPGYVPTNGLVGWWPFNGNANDESGNGNNGMVYGATLTTDRNGVVNRAYSFDGVNDGISINNTLLSNTPASYSVNFWCKLDTTLPSSTTGNGFTVFDDCDSIQWFGKGRFLALGNNYFNPNFSFRENFGNLSEDTNPSFYVWVNYSCVLNTANGKFYLYKNSNLVDSATFNSSYYRTGNRKTQFGRCQSPIRYNGIDYFTSHWKGKIDDIGFWNRALTPQEITSLYQGCNLNVTANPSTANAAIGANISFSGSGGTSFQWQTNPANNGWQNVNNNSTYSGAGTATLSISNVQLQNHQQQFRVISASGNCADTAYALINVTDTCINTITTSIAVTDTLIINAVLSGVNPPNNSNTLLVYPNPARTHITIDNGNFALMNGYTVRINNALGQTVFTQAVNQQQFFIDLSTWTGNGLYYLDLIDNSGNSVERKVIVVQ